jgi:hypothetical protein
LRGRPLGLCAGLLILWTMARINYSDVETFTRQSPATARAADVIAAQQQAATAQTFPAAFEFENIMPQRGFYAATPRSITGPAAKPWPIHTVKDDPPLPLGPHHPVTPDAQSSLAHSPINMFPINTARSQVTAPVPALPSAVPPQSARRLRYYAYSFWRSGQPGTDQIAPAAQYGGSQSGIIANYRLTDYGGGGRGLSLLVRAAATPGKFSDEELAVGLRWQPFNALPMNVSAERRIRTQSPDQFAVYAAGSAGNVPLILGLRARGFAQAGVIPARQPNIFFDAGMRAETKLVDSGKSAVSIGLGGWAGGQRGASRFDIGPTIRGDIGIGRTRLDISADWRFRVGGNARPGNGPAVTISTGY